MRDGVKILVKIPFLRDKFFYWGVESKRSWVFGSNQFSLMDYSRIKKQVESNKKELHIILSQRTRKIKIQG